MWMRKLGDVAVIQQLVSGGIAVLVMIAGWAGWARDTARDWPLLPQIAFYIALFAIGFGVSFGAIRAVSVVWRWFQHRHLLTDPLPVPSSSLNELTTMVREIRGELIGDAQDMAAPIRFDNRALIYDRPLIDLGQIFRTGTMSDPAFTVRMNLRNVSPFPVTITGIEGQPTIDGRACTLARTKPFPRHHLASPDDYWTFEIEQPLTPQMAEYIRIGQLDPHQGGLAEAMDSFE